MDSLGGSSFNTVALLH